MKDDMKKILRNVMPIAILMFIGWLGFLVIALIESILIDRVFPLLSRKSLIKAVLQLFSVGVMALIWLTLWYKLTKHYRNTGKLI